MTHTSLPFWLAATYLPGVGPRTFLRWLTLFSNIETLFHAPHEELAQAGLHTKHIHALKNPNWQAVENDIAWMQASENHLISFADPRYPALLKEMGDAPLVLYLRGSPAVLACKQLAIVGARNATPTGVRNAEWFARTLAQANIAITSGLAAGVDAAAHKGALAVDGVTIGVAGTGLHHTYPRSHVALVQDIIQKNGAVISEFPLQTTPHAANFPRRNRIIAGLSIGTLVVEAAIKSGSLITARHAIEHGRDVFAIPGSIHQPLARGCHYLIRQGAKLVETAADIVEELGAMQAIFDAPSYQKELDLSENERQLLEKIEYEITPMDMILLRSGLTASEVSSILLSLELHGYVQSVPGGYVRVVLC